MPPPLFYSFESELTIPFGMRKELTMARTQSAALDRKKLMADPIMVTTIVVLIAFLTLFILYPLAILLVDSFVGDGTFGVSIFQRIFAMPTFTKAITNTLKVGFLVGRHGEFAIVTDFDDTDGHFIPGFIPSLGFFFRDQGTVHVVYG